MWVYSQVKHKNISEYLKVNRASQSAVYVILSGQRWGGGTWLATRPLRRSQLTYGIGYMYLHYESF